MRMLAAKRLAYTVLCTSVIFSPMAANANSQQNHYPADAVQNFMNGCVAKAGEQNRQICTCMINKFQNKYTLEKFSQIEAKMQLTGKVPDEYVNDFAEIIGSCRVAGR